MFQKALLLSSFLVLSSCGILEKSDDDEEEASDPVKVDILLVLDNSDSMSDEAAGVMMNIHHLVTDGGSGPSFGSVEGIDYRVAVTTTSAVFPEAHGFTNGVDPGESGTFAGTVVTPDTSSGARALNQNVACWATCWHAYEMESNPNYTGTSSDCPMPDGGATIQYVDCLCNGIEYPVDTDWDDSDLCGSGQEMQVEAALLAMCRAVDAPPDICFEQLGVGPEALDDWEGSNAGWLRDDSSVVVIMITDEGDASPLFETGQDDATQYLAAFDAFERPVKFMAIGPDYDCDADGNCDLPCNNGGATPNGIKRLMNMVEATGGIYGSITDEDCDVADFEVLFDRMRGSMTASSWSPSAE